MAVEAALVLPLFFFFCINVLWSVEMIRLQGRLDMALHQVGNTVSYYGFYYRYGTELLRETAGAAGSGAGGGAYDGSGKDDAGGTDGGAPGEGGGLSEARLLSSGISFLLSQTYVRDETAKRAGRTYLDNTCLSGGAGSISYLRSSIMDGDDIVSLKADYRVQPFTRIIGYDGFSMSSVYYGHAWTGYASGGSGEPPDESDEEIVYVTETGRVYHRDRGCSYLNPHIIAVSAGEVGNRRSRDGSIYYACEHCRPARTGLLYITTDGNRYHCAADCPGLKRTIREVPLSEVAGRLPPCSKCGY